MTSRGNILFITYQYACAKNLLPVANTLLEQNCLVSVCASGKSTDVWNGFNGAVEVVDEDLSEREILKILEDQKINIIFTGTDSISPFEFNFRIAATKLKIKSYSFLDYWSFYRERFYRPGRGNSIPDKVFVIDDVAKRELINCGISERNIMVSGSPSYEQIVSDYQKPVSKDNNSILFVSQPIFEIFNDELGLSELDILEFMISSLSEAGYKFNYHIKPHPREDSGKFLGIVEKYPDESIKIIDGEENLYSILGKFTYISGIVSNVLLESSILGLKTFSIQYGTNHAFRFFATDAGLIPVANESDGLLDIIRKFENRDFSIPDLSYMYKGAKNKIINEVLK